MSEELLIVRDDARQKGEVVVKRHFLLLSRMSVPAISLFHSLLQCFFFKGGIVTGAAGQR